MFERILSRNNGNQPLKPSERAAKAWVEVPDDLFNLNDSQLAAKLAEIIAKESGCDEMLEALSVCEKALKSGNPDSTGDVTIYLLEGTEVYRALNAARALIAKYGGTQ